MNLRPLLLCAAAALAGWHGMAWWRGSRPQDAAPPPPSASALPTANPSASSGSSSLAAMGAEISRLPDAAAAAAIEHWDAQPPGTARTLALAMLKARVDYASDPFDDPFGPSAPEAKRKPDSRETLRANLMADEQGEYAGCSEMAEWVALDPAAATAAILQMPPGKARGIAVDNAAVTLALSNPAAAWDLVVKSGEQNPGPGAAQAWAHLLSTSGDAPPPAVPPSMAAGLCAALTSLIKEPDEAFGLPELGDKQLDMAVAVSALPSSQAKTDLVVAIADKWPMTSIFVAHMVGLPAVLAQSMIHRAAADPDAVAGELLNYSQWGEAPAVLNAAAPRLAPLLAESGHVQAAARLLPTITDPETRRTTLEAILPQWMDTNPAAARAAFQAAPFTALERERWLRHPAFLLNP